MQAKIRYFPAIWRLDQPLSLLYTVFMNFIVYLQAVFGVLLIFGILLQHRASGLSATFGGSDTSYVQRRGAERVLYQATIAVSIAFFALTILDWYV